MRDMNMWDTHMWWGVVGALVVLVVYWALLMRTIADMIRNGTHTVVLIFACLSLGPFPPQVVMGILWIIFWAYFKKGEASRG